MAVTLETVSVTIKQSIARVELFTDAFKAQADWSLVFHFEDGSYNSSGALVGTTQFGTRRVERSFGAIANDTIISSDGTLTVTVAQLADLIKQGGYKYRQEDIDAA